METQTKTRASEISSQKRWKEKARRAKQPRLSGSRQRATLNRAEKRTRTSETQVMPKIRRAPTKAATNRRRTKSRARTTHVSQAGSLTWSFFYDANYVYGTAQSVIYTGLFVSVLPDFQYRNEKLVAANQRYFFRKFSMARANLVLILVLGTDPVNTINRNAHHPECGATSSREDRDQKQKPDRKHSQKGLRC